MDEKINHGALAGAAGNVPQDCDRDTDEAIASSLDLQAIRVELSERRRKRGDCVPAPPPVQCCVPRGRDNPWEYYKGDRHF